MPELVSVVIPTFNRSVLLAECLRALLREGEAHGPIEVLVVDSYSTDDTSRVVRSCGDEGLTVSVLQADNVVSVKRNLGARRAKGEILVFVDDDCVPTEGFISSCREALRLAGRGRVVVCGEVRFPTPSVGASNLQRYRDAMHFKGVTGRLSPLKFNHIVTMNMCVDRRMFVTESGFFDESFIGYGGEDVELGWRLLQSGWMILAGWQLVEHREPSVGLSEWRRKFVRAGEHGNHHLKHVQPAALWSIRSSWLLEPDYPHRSAIARLVATCLRSLLRPALASLLTLLLNLTDGLRMAYFPLGYRYVGATDILEGVRRRSLRPVDPSVVRTGWYSQ